MFTLKRNSQPIGHHGLKRMFMFQENPDSLMDEWSERVKAMIPELIKEHALIHDVAVKSAGLYSAKSFEEFEELVLAHIDKEETWVFPYMVEHDIYDERSEEIASQHQEITGMLGELRGLKGEEFRDRFLKLVDLLQRHHSGEEEWLFPRIMKYISAQQKGR